MPPRSSYLELPQRYVHKDQRWHHVRIVFALQRCCCCPPLPPCCDGLVEPLDLSLVVCTLLYDVRLLDWRLETKLNQLEYTNGCGTRAHLGRWTGVHSFTCRVQLFRHPPATRVKVVQLQHRYFFPTTGATTATAVAAPATAAAAFGWCSVLENIHNVDGCSRTQMIRSYLGV